MWILVGWLPLVCLRTWIKLLSPEFLTCLSSFRNTNCLDKYPPPLLFSLSQDFNSCFSLLFNIEIFYLVTFLFNSVFLSTSQYKHLDLWTKVDLDWQSKIYPKIYWPKYCIRNWQLESLFIHCYILVKKTAFFILISAIFIYFCSVCT